MQWATVGKGHHQVLVRVPGSERESLLELTRPVHS